MMLIMTMIAMATMEMAAALIAGSARQPSLTGTGSSNRAAVFRPGSPPALAARR